MTARRREGLEGGGNDETAKPTPWEVDARRAVMAEGYYYFVFLFYFFVSYFRQKMQIRRRYIYLVLICRNLLLLSNEGG